MTAAPLTLYNSFTRALEPSAPLDPAHLRVYSCGPTVYNHAHIDNLRAYVFTDTLSRHLTSDADAGDDKMEAAARAASRSIWDIAAH